MTDEDGRAVAESVGVLLNCALRYGPYYCVRTTVRTSYSEIEVLVIVLLFGWFFSERSRPPFECLIWIVTGLTCLAVAAASVSFYNQIGVGVSRAEGKSINFSETAMLWF